MEVHELYHVCLILIIEINVNVSVICVIKQLAICKYCALLSYDQFIIVVGLKTDTLFKGASSEASSSVHCLKIWLSHTSKPIN